ncbi:MAG: hypothetical protein RR249_00895 [Tannerellaceae bacterium]
MKPIVLAGVQRHSLFSPNNVGNDATIFNATAACLRQAGYEVNLYTEQEFLGGRVAESCLITMMRSEQAIRRLQSMERQGCLAVNSGFGIENCTRERMTNLLINHHIPHPRSLVLDTEKTLCKELLPAWFTPCWVKRADFHAIHREDVTQVSNPDELAEVIAEYAARGISRVVINEHLAGDLVKFYGVAGSDFFYWFYPYEANHSKFGLEEINGKPKGIHFSLDGLKAICDTAARALGITVYGGDGIVSRDGTVRVIDFNDWPSFAPCREEASRAIARMVVLLLTNKETQ